MRNLKKVVILILCLTCSFSAMMVSFAKECGNITVSIKDKYSNKISGLNVHLCQIAKMEGTGYYPTEEFENSGIALSNIINNPDDLAAKNIKTYIEQQNINTISKVSEDGQVVFENIDLGIWIVYCDNDNGYVFNPYIVFVPNETAGKMKYDIVSTPKIEEYDPNNVSIYVLKRWDDNNDLVGKRPDAVQVELLDKGVVISSVELKEENGWAHTFSGLSESGSYSVKEKDVRGYTAHYDGDAKNGFIITNTYSGNKLPQTGQYWWPIILMLIAGIGFVVLGLYEIGAKKNGKKI